MKTVDETKSDHSLDLEALIEKTLQIEGGWSDQPGDRGGPTNWGITLEKFRDFHGVPGATVSELKALTRDGARSIYRWIFQKEMGLASIGATSDPTLQGLIYDCVVNHGATGATRLLQAAVGVASDGFIGPKTRAALAAANPRRLYLRLAAGRFRLYADLATKDPANQLKFLGGWADRAARFVEEAP